MKKELGIFITVFIALLIGVILIGTVADNIEEAEMLRYQTNTTFTAVNATFTAVTAGDRFLTSIEFRNYTGETLVEDTDYIMNYDAGTINVSVATVVQNEHLYTFFVNYTFYPNAYAANETTSQNLVGLVVLFFAIGLMALGAVMVYRTFPEIFGK